MGVYDFPETVDDADSMASLTMYHVIKAMGWENVTGHYIYYKLKFKKPKKGTLNLMTSNNFKNHIDYLNNELNNLSPEKYQNIHTKISTNEYISSSSSSDDDIEDNIIIEKTLSTFDPDFQFNRKCPYNDIINIDKLADHELARVTALRMQLTDDIWEMCTY